MAATKRALRAVSAEEPPPAPAPVLTLAQAVETGDYLTILVAQRREIAESLPDERGPAKAALHRQLSIIAKEIEAQLTYPGEIKVTLLREMRVVEYAR